MEALLILIVGCYYSIFPRRTILRTPELKVRDTRETPNVPINYDTDILAGRAEESPFDNYDYEDSNR